MTNVLLAAQSACGMREASDNEAIVRCWKLCFVSNKKVIITVEYNSIVNHLG